MIIWVDSTLCGDTVRIIAGIVFAVWCRFELFKTVNAGREGKWNSKLWLFIGKHNDFPGILAK